MYHNVAKEPKQYESLGSSITSYFVSRELFASQVQDICAWGGWFLNADQVKAFFANRQLSTSPSWPKGHPVLLSFDDGWRETVEVGGPILKANHCQAYLFVTTQFIGQANFVDRRILSNLPREQFILGSHARTHRLLSLLSDDEIRSELKDSKGFLEDIGGHAIEALSIPGGAWDRRVRQIASEVGYRFVFTSEAQVNSRRSGPLAIGRLAVKEKTSTSTMRRFVEQRIISERIRRTLLQGPKRILGLARYEKLRRYLLGQNSDHP
jgi:peptidoglycan/xylan/chitin deacetylase (PgdA/CDA1 family)